jgi:4-hydroxy-tetrahydrodipicolinate synthase
MANLEETKKKIRGVMCLALTPLNKDFSLNEDTIRKEVDWAVELGATGIWADGYAAQCHKLDEDVRMRAHEVFLDAAQKRGVFCGVGIYGINHFQAIRLAKHGEKIGADAGWLPAPRPAAAEGIYQYFKAIHDNTNLPMSLYSTNALGVYMPPTLIDRITSMERFVGMKDVYEDFGHVAGLINTGVYNRIKVLACTMLTFNFMVGAAGALAVPQLLKRTIEIYNTYKSEGWQKSLELELKLKETHKIGFSTYNTKIHGNLYQFPTGAMSNAGARELVGADFGPPMLPELPPTEADLKLVHELGLAGKDMPFGA